MFIFYHPTPYLDYIPPHLTEGKEWYVSYSVKNPETGKMKRFRIKINRIHNIRERRAAAKILIAQLQEKLALGWNPLLEAAAPKAYHRMFETLDSFLKAKSREMEPNSMRSYRSYIHYIKKWLLDHGQTEQMYVCSFTIAMAHEFMDELEDSGDFSPRTYNNYLAFCKILFNWMVDRQYVSANPFQDIKKKSKRLTKKNRRILTEEERARLFEYLPTFNKEYTAMCLMCYCCLLRPKEIALLKVGDIDLKKQLIHISGTIAKNDNDSSRTIPDDMVPYLKALDLSHPNLYLFGKHRHCDFSPGKEPVCSREIARVWDRYVRKNCHFSMDVQFYSLKDTGVTNMIGAGVPISFVQQQADHSSVAMTAIYLGRQEEKANETLRSVDIIPEDSHRA